MVTDPLRHLIRRPWRDLELPAHAGGVPTMLSKLERRLLYSLARDYATGESAIVDAGCFLGGSTAALLAGVADRPEPWTGPPVSSYDLFRVEAFTIPKFFRDYPSVRVGDSFRERYDEHVARFDVPHRVHEGDITQIGWDGGPIDVLFLDVLKSWRINDAVLRGFFPSLIPGRSLIIHQDYGWGWMPWLPITVELMRDSLVLVDWMEWGTHVFFVERELPADVIESGVEHLDLDTRFELIEQAINRSEGWIRGMMEISRAALILERDGKEAALRALNTVAEYHQDHGQVLGCIADVRPQLGEADGRTWTARVADVRTRIAAALR